MNRSKKDTAQNKRCCINGCGAVKTDSVNKSGRMTWVKETLGQIPVGSRILDAGAGILGVALFWLPRLGKEA